MIGSRSLRHDSRSSKSVRVELSRVKNESERLSVAESCAAKRLPVTPDNHKLCASRTEDRRNIKLCKSACFYYPA